MLDTIDLQNLLLLDIETVPQYDTYEVVPENFKELWDKKTLYQRKNDESPADFYNRAGIWAEFGKIVCISVGVFTKTGGTLGLRLKSFYGHEEKPLLEDFINLLNKQPSNLVLCAHNGKEFDFPYLCRRMLINGLKIPSLLQISGKKPWEIAHLDTMELWKFGDFKNYTSLNLLAAVFNIPTPKDDIDGSEVHRVYWQENDLQRIRTYCQKDVATVAQLLLRFKNINLIPEEQITIVA